MWIYNRSFLSVKSENAWITVYAKNHRWIMIIRNTIYRMSSNEFLLNLKGNARICSPLLKYQLCIPKIKITSHDLPNWTLGRFCVWTGTHPKIYILTSCIIIIKSRSKTKPLNAGHLEFSKTHCLSFFLNSKAFLQIKCLIQCILLYHQARQSREGYYAFLRCNFITFKTATT